MNAPRPRNGTDHAGPFSRENLMVITTPSPSSRCSVMTSPSTVSVRVLVSRRLPFQFGKEERRHLLVLEDAAGVDGVGAEDHERVADGAGVLRVAAGQRIAGGERGQARPVQHVGEVPAVGEDQVAARRWAEGLRGSFPEVSAWANVRRHAAATWLPLAERGGPGILPDELGDIVRAEAEGLPEPAVARVHADVAAGLPGYVRRRVSRDVLAGRNPSRWSSVPWSPGAAGHGDLRPGWPSGRRRRDLESVR